MPRTVKTSLPEDSDERLLALAALFEGEFCIDWVQALSEARASRILKAFDRFSREGVLRRHDIGMYSLADPKSRGRLRAGLPSDRLEGYHRRIAALFMDESPGDEGLFRAARQLLRIDNDLEGCRVLGQAGDQYRRSGRSDEALACYNKAIEDLRKLKGIEADTLFIETVIGYSKDHQAIHYLKRLISYLHEALERAERWKNQRLQALVLMHLASNIYIGQNAEAAQAYLDRGFALARDINDPNVERTVITGTIVSHFYSGRYKAAVKIYETFEPLFAEKYPLHQLSLRMGVLMGVSYACLGQISQGMGLLDGLRVHALKIQDHHTAATAAADMGLVLMLTSSFDEAIELVKKVLAESPDSNEFAKCFCSYYLAYCFFRKGELETSRRYLARALKKSDQYDYGIKYLPYYIEICLAAQRGEYPALPGMSPEGDLRQMTTGTNVVAGGVAHRCLAILAGRDPAGEVRFKHLTRSLALLEESGHVTEIAKTQLELGRHYLLSGDTGRARELVAAAVKPLYPIDRGLVPEDLEHLVRDLRVEDNLLEEILNLGQEVVALRDTQEVVQHIFSTVNRITGAERGAIFLKTDDPGSVPIKLWAAKNLTADDAAHPEFSPSIEMIGRSVDTGQADIQNVSPPPNGASFYNDTIKSRICVPLSLRGRTIGVLYHDNRFFKSTFKEQDVKILSYFASLAAIALDNAQAYEEIRRLNQRLQEEKQYLEEQQLESLHLDDFVAASPAIKHVLSMVQRVAETDSTVLILGETGAGKEMVARAIHQHSPRRDKPFIRVHCSAFPESLIPSELFGHERGAFTGAVERRIGRFELADGGTIFLDEIGDIPMGVQVRLLRVLQTKEFERVGGRETLRSDFRLLAATNRNLEEEVEAGRFRSDLYYRLNVFPIQVPPLRERREDIAPLAGYFLRVYAEKTGKSFKGIPEKEMARLLAYHWPGNVRELENVIERGVILNAGGLFLIPELTAGPSDAPAAGLVSLKEMERRFIIEALQKTNWKIYGPGGAAELLDINYSTLYSRMKKLGIRKPRKSTGDRSRS
ncbi:MAG: sigma 54-interacting transcriptional regulator [Proteobacteria bacterium]|nr:sigma 54-interacting transcriptional regulator [Pseudomonadota bacterium]